MLKKRYKIAVLPGDGIGPEIMAEAIKILKVINKKYNYEFIINIKSVGGVAYDESGNHLPDSTIDICNKSDAILFGSVGGPVDLQDLPKWKDCEKNCILKLRKYFNLGINVRPSIIYKSIKYLSPLKNELLNDNINIIIIRELIGGIYFGEHKTINLPDGTQKSYDVMEYNEYQIKNIMNYSFKCASKRKKRLCVVDKANVLDTSRLWRKVSKQISLLYPDITLEFMYFDYALMKLIQNPSYFDVIATSNMFGDILSDAASILPGSIGLMPSISIGNTINLYEPAGGSAPDIAGQQKANPIGQILCVALMLRYSFNLENEANDIENAINIVLENGFRTYDLLNKYNRTSTPSNNSTTLNSNILTTSEMGDAIVNVINSKKK